MKINEILSVATKSLKNTINIYNEVRVGVPLHE